MTNPKYINADFRMFDENLRIIPIIIFGWNV